MRFLLISLALACAAFAARAESADPRQEAANAYRIEVGAAPLKVKKGSTAEARVAVVPRAGAHVHPDAPISLSVAAGGAVDLPKAKLGRSEARETAQKGVEFQVPVVGKATGADELKGSLSFFICTEKVCERQRRDVRLAVLVE